MMWQVVEKESFGTDWHQVLYDTRAMERFNTEEEALIAAKKYLTIVNCDNALTKEEKKTGLEAFMMMKDGCFLGILDGEDWYLHDRHGKIVKDASYFELEGKSEVSVRTMPGT